MQPLISCLCPTRNNPNIVKKAIKAFEKQTYDNKELILVIDEGSKYEESIKSFTKENIKLFYAPKGITLGDIRNISVENASGKYIAQWDDDNTHCKNRLEIQYNAIETHKKKACFLQRVLINDTISGKKGISNFGRGIESTIVALKSSLPKYPSIGVGEDVIPRKYFTAISQVVYLDKPHLYTYNIHNNNTCEYKHLKTMLEV